VRRAHHSHVEQHLVRTAHPTDDPRTIG